jgi:asparagine synthase (glutamine-hydrolysing)
MCGIVGTMNLGRTHPIEEGQLRQMLAMIRHRGPDQFGIYLDDHIGIGSARLSIIDLSGGQQPISNETGTLWIVCNGEIFNYVELRPALEAKGHRFTTQTDTEVVLHLYEELGPQCLHQLDGDFAMAIWDAKQQTLFLARDRVGVRPLFYTVTEGALIFGSEIKAILADRRVRAQIDPTGMDQVFCYWCSLSPRTVFRGVQEVPPGHYLLAKDGSLRIQSYWQVSFSVAEEPHPVSPRREAELLAELRERLINATQIRLRADVPVGAYLSGGLDSSTVAAIVRRYTANRLDTFSISFSDPKFDESRFQREMAAFLGTEHQVVYATHADISRAFPEVVWHAETPLLRTAPVPMFLLSKLVRDRHFKVVLTGEGADEFLAGYDIFKEAMVRRFWARQPDSKWRPRLLQRLYPDIAELAKNSPTILAVFFGEGLMNTGAHDYSHAIRWRNNRRTRRFFSKEWSHAINTESAANPTPVYYPPGFQHWDPLQRAQFLEITIFLSQYLLSSQGDRVAMAHSVEGRFPFLDCHLVEFCNRLPSTLKLRGLSEKYLLKKLAREWLPTTIWTRPKRPYRAPIHRSFFHQSTPDYVRELLSPNEVKAAGFFKPTAVSQLVKKIEASQSVGETDDMALAGIISTQLLYRQFITHFSLLPPLSGRDNVKVCRGTI